jgi:hypothetical protein
MGDGHEACRAVYELVVPVTSPFKKDALVDHRVKTNDRGGSVHALDVRLPEQVEEVERLHVAFDFAVALEQFDLQRQPPCVH